MGLFAGLSALFAEKSKKDISENIDNDNNAGNKDSGVSSLKDGVSLAVGAETLSTYGEAGRQINIGLTGVDNVAGTKMKKSLMSISKSKINPEWSDNNIKQQAGFSAEVLDTAKRNADAVKNGETVRYSRIDDLPNHAINETAYDVTAIDMTTGREIADSAAQMKFAKNTPKELADTLTSKKFGEKYPHGTFRVASDDYPKVMEDLAAKEQSLSQQIAKAEQSGNTDLIQKKTAELERTQQVRNNLQKSTVSREEAIFAREHPQLTAAKETLKLGHEAGMQYAVVSGGISCAVSAVSNISKLLSGDITPGEATANIAKDTAKASAKGYVIGQANTALTSVMTNSSNQVIQALGKTNAPAYMISMATSVFSAMKKYINGETTAAECVDSITRSGVGMAGSAIGGTLGGSLGPAGTIIGAVIGGIVIDNLYTYVSNELKAPYYAKQERLKIEAQCNELHKSLELYRQEFEATYIAHTKELSSTFGHGIVNMAKALSIQDADAFISNANAITISVGGKPQFNNVKEFGDFLDSDEPFEL